MTTRIPAPPEDGNVMDEGCKTLLTMVSVALALLLSRRGGRHTAGLAAAWPTVTGPALVWISHDSGPAFAADAAVASIAACAMLAAFAWAYAAVARRGMVAAMVAGTVAAAAASLPARWVSDNLVASLALAFGACALALAAMPVAPVRLDGPCHEPPLAATALVAGLLGAACSAAGQMLGSVAAGWLASLPVISGVLVVAGHAAEGCGGAVRFLRGYVVGLFGKAAFGAVFALAVTRQGSMVACLAGCASVVLASLAWRPRSSLDEADSLPTGKPSPPFADSIGETDFRGMRRLHGRGHRIDRTGARG